jgi:hypothetical protein
MAGTGTLPALASSVGATRTSVADQMRERERERERDQRWVGDEAKGGRRTFKVDHVAAAYALAPTPACHFLRRAAPKLCDLSPGGKLANRARFVADDETQHGDDVTRVRPTTHRHLVRPVDLEHGEQQARVTPRRGKWGQCAERELKVGESRDGRRVGRVGIGVGRGLVFFILLCLGSDFLAW